jgi:hypothetical protein
MKKLILISFLLAAIVSNAGAMGHFHRSPQHHGHHHSHHGHHTGLTTPDEQKPVH